MKIAILSDIHSNIFALRSVLEDLSIENVDYILVAGDIVGYYYWPLEVVETLMTDARFICIRGNHENILRETLLCKKSAGFYKKKYGSGYDFCKFQLSPNQLEWLASLPAEVSVEIGDKTFYMSHGALNSSESYLYPNSSEGEILLNYSDSDFTIFGHTHYPFLHTHNLRYMLNPGSIGQPRDIGGLTSYIVINLENNVIRFKRTVYDVQPVIKASAINDPELKYLAEIMNR